MNRVELGCVSFRICWLCIFVVHAAVAGFYLLVASAYLQMLQEGIALAGFLSYYSIGMHSQHYSVIAAVYILCGALHGINVVAMLIGSLLQHRPSFHVVIPERISRVASITANYPGRFTHVHGYLLRACTQISHSRGYQRLVCMVMGAKLAYNRVFSSTGWLGVDGKHYGVILQCRELVEMALQTQQAYQMTRLLPREMLNRMYLILFELNCWATVAIRVAMAKKTSSEQFFSLLLDCMLDLVSSVGIPLAVILFYLDDFDWSIRGFPFEVTINDEWFVKAKNELQIVVVVSWSDLGSHVGFTLGLLISMSDMKQLLVNAGDKVGVKDPIRDGDNAGQTPFAFGIVSSTVTPTPVAHETAVPMKPRAVTGHQYHSLVSKGFCVLVASWGSVLLALHLHATSIPSIPSCLLQVRPWGKAMPYCSLVEINCNRLHISGSAQEVEALWKQVGRTTVERIVIRHCQQLEMPSLVTDFTSLNTFKVYNSTITKWEADAAITATSHPHIQLIYLVRVSLPDGAIPAGLLSQDTLWTLDEITITVSNLRRLPDDLDSLWPKGIIINLELSELTAVPDTLVRLLPSSLSLYGNPIESLPSALFEVEGLLRLSVGMSKLTALPQNVSKLSSTLTYVAFTNMSVAFFWTWVDSIIYTWVGVLAMFGTSYCAEYARILEGSATNFPLLPPSDTPYSMLMDMSTHSQNIAAHVMCRETDAQSIFPLATEDAFALTATE